MAENTIHTNQDLIMEQLSRMMAGEMEMINGTLMEHGVKALSEKPECGLKTVR